MPFTSQHQARAMFAAKDGTSTLGIPPKAGAEFVNASAGQPVSALPEYMDAQQGHRAKGKTHRGRRSKGRGPMTAAAHQREAQQHMANAQQAATPKASLSHLFKAIRSTHAAVQAAPVSPIL